MGIQNLGGIPRIKRLTVDTTGQFIQFEALSSALHLKAHGDLRIFATKADFDTDTNFYECVTNEILDIPWEDRGIWLKAGTGSHLAEIIVFHRKG